MGKDVILDSESEENGHGGIKETQYGTPHHESLQGAFKGN
jgi:hypothetical protein